MKKSRKSARNSFFYHLIAVALLAVILPAAVVAQSDPGCCIGRVGDVNGLGGDEPTIGDITIIIDAKFITSMPCEEFLPCLQEADVNQSGGLYPMCEDITIGDITILIDYLFITGPSLGLPDCLEPSSDPHGYLVSNTGCKSFDKDGADQNGDTESCLQYDYDGTGTLSLTHINAAFNCCPDYLTAVFSIVDNTITITEGENLNSGGCDCICLFDVQFQINNLPPGEYRIVVVELYPSEGDPLDFTIDLVQNPSGLLCVDRTGYPWGDGEPGLEFIGNTGCLPEGAATSGEVNDQTCVTYEYNEFGTLSIHREMAGFNCCPSELGASFSIDGNTITITEYELFENGGCYCLCLFNMEYWITNLPPGEYNIVFEEPYMPTGDQPLELTVDLTSPTEGTHCEARSAYPWGY